MLLLPCLGAEIVRNMTVIPAARSPFRAALDPSIGKVLLYFTAVAKEHSSSDHMGDLTHLWPVVLRKNQMLRSADIILYTAVEGDSNHNEMIFRHLEMSAEAFPNELVKIFLARNVGYQEGAIEAMLDGARNRWFEGYDW